MPVNLVVHKLSVKLTYLGSIKKGILPTKNFDMGSLERPWVW